MILNSLVEFFAWLGIQPSLQDLVKAGLLVLFVLATLMVVGDVYRGEIQNKLHRVLLAITDRTYRTHQRASEGPRKSIRRERDITCHVPQSVVPLTLDGVHSNVLFYFRYRDCSGKLKSKLIETYRSKFHVRKIGIAQSYVVHPEYNKPYSADEDDTLAAEEASTSIISLAGSRVDYLFDGKIEPLMEKERGQLERMRKNVARRVLSGVKGDQLRDPEPVGIAVKFHFPIDPHFLLYKHPDTNVRTTAWLTVLTSVFALFMQLIYSGGTTTATATQPAQDAERPAIVRGVNSN